MRKSLLVNVLLGCVLCTFAAFYGCYIQIGGWSMPGKFERTVQLSKPMTPGTIFSADTYNGSITVNGSNVNECRLQATITARAGTKEEAEELTKQIKITLQESDNKILVRIDRPPILVGKSISVELAAVVPNQTSPELITQNGAVRIEDINGKIQAIAYNGPVIGERLSGNINLTTHNGRIDCSGIAGDIEVRTHNGEVDVVYSRTASGVINASVITHNGGIYFHAPPNLSASAELIAHNGIVKTKRPISIVGQISTKELKGTFGEGEGKLHLETQNGSIKIK